MSLLADLTALTALFLHFVKWCQASVVLLLFTNHQALFLLLNTSVTQGGVVFFQETIWECMKSTLLCP